MISQLPAYILAVAGDALNYELLLLAIFGIVLGIRVRLYRALRWFQQQSESDEDLRIALWKLLRGQS